MRLWKLHPGDPAPIQATERPEPHPARGEVRVDLRAASLNYRDLLLARGGPGSPRESGRIPLSDGAGIVTALGDGVVEWKVGDRVTGCFFRDWIQGGFDMRHHSAARGGSVDGMLAPCIVGPAHSFVTTPTRLSDLEAACLPCAALTAWNALVTNGALRAGQTVLVQGTGGVSTFALQFATALGAQVIVTSSSDIKLDEARALGAWAGINYRTHPEWHREVWRLTEKRGVDHVLDVGGEATLDSSIQSLAAGGHLAVIGVLTGAGPVKVNWFPLVTKNARASGIYVGSRADFLEMNTFLNRTPIRPVIDRVLEFEEAPRAWELLAQGAHRGKIVIRFPDGPRDSRASVGSGV